MSGFGDYLEGNYDVGKEEEQRAEDIKEAIALVKEVKKEQEKAAANEKERILKKYEFTGEKIDTLLAEYAKEDKLKEYLVDGAILKCNQATTDNFTLPNGEEVILEKQGSDVECCQTVLHVTENPVSANRLIYATVKDTVLHKNIIPPKCNCKLKADRDEEVKKIMADSECNENGVCRHLMRLNEEWENMEISGTKYMTKSNVEASFLTAGSEDAFISIRNAEQEKVEGITMTSILFCKHGGLIIPVESGQLEIICVSEELIDLLKKYETGMDKNGNYLNEGEPALYPYHSPSDDDGVLTIGWGHAMAGYDKGWFEFNDGTIMNLYDMYIYDRVDGNKINQVVSISKGQAEEILQSDIKSIEDTLNSALSKKGISARVNQRFYDALFMLTYQMGPKCLTVHTDLPSFLTPEKFNLWDRQEVKEQFGEYSNHLEQGTMRRRADELDIIFDGDYERDYDEKRYGDIWGKKTAAREAEARETAEDY